MLYAFSKLFEVVAEPSNLLVLVLVLGVLLLWLGRRRWGARLVTLAALGLVAFALLPLGEWATAPLEDRFPAPELPPRIDGIILLGGAIRMGPSVAHDAVSLNSQAARITETLALARHYPAAPVLVTGGDAEIVPRGHIEADLMRKVLVEDGLDERRILIEARSRNTYENAVDSKALAQPRPGQVWLLVTSAFHMPRAVGCFRRVGWDVVPYPVDYRLGAHFEFGFSMVGGLENFNLAMHEWVGLAAYRLLGRINSWFPGP